MPDQIEDRADLIAANTRLQDLINLIPVAKAARETVRVKTAAIAAVAKAEAEAVVKPIALGKVVDRG